MTDLATSADILLRATARARSFHGKTFVIKLGGSAMEDPAATAGTLDSIATLHQLGLQLILVHGGGKPIDRAMAAANLEVKKVLGRRYTDDTTLEIVMKVLMDICEDIVAKLNSRGATAEAASLFDASILRMKDPGGLEIDLGHVGVPTKLHKQLALQLLSENKIIVNPSFARGSDSFLNVNADTAASAVAGAMKAEACLFLTDTPGVLRDRNDPASLLPRLTVAQCKQLIADKVIDGGMIPKVEACFEALDAGAGKAVILDGRNPHSLLSLVLSDTLTGTEITQ